jgi:hypothetical protein
VATQRKLGELLSARSKSFLVHARQSAQPHEGPEHRNTTQGVVQRSLRPFEGEQDRFELILPDGHSIHLTFDRRDTIADLKQYVATLLRENVTRIGIAEYVGEDLAVGDGDWLGPNLIYKATRTTGQAELEGKSKHKALVAARIERALSAVSYDVMLGGGGAAAIRGSGRAIKDLDFKMGSNLQTAYKSDAHGVADAVLSALARADIHIRSSVANPHVLKLVVALDRPDTDFVEVSITPTGRYQEVPAAWAEDDPALITDAELLLDKLFAFAERSTKDLHKLATDFIDVITLVKLQPTLESPHLLAERMSAYRKKQGRAGSTMVADFAEQIRERASLVVDHAEVRTRLGVDTEGWVLWLNRVARTAVQLGMQA